MSDFKKTFALALLIFSGYLLYSKVSYLYNDYKIADEKEKKEFTFTYITAPISRYFKTPWAKRKNQIVFFDGTVAKIGKAFRISDNTIIIHISITNKGKKESDIGYKYRMFDLYAKVKGKLIAGNQIEDEKYIGGLKLLRNKLLAPNQTIYGFVAFDFYGTPINTSQFILYNIKDENYMINEIPKELQVESKRALSLEFWEKRERIVRCGTSIYSIEDVKKRTNNYY